MLSALRGGATVENVVSYGKGVGSMSFTRRIARLAAGALFGVVVVVGSSGAMAQEKGQYLVTGTGGPGWNSPEEGVGLLENVIIPALDLLARQAAEGTVILAGGLPVGDRAVTFIIEAADNDEADRFVRSVPVWIGFEWTVTPLQSFRARADMERGYLRQMKEMIAQ